MAPLLFEIGTEELPSWYVTRAERDLRELLETRLAEARLAHGAIVTYATPRRLAARVDDLADASERHEELRRGPSEEVAFRDGEPTRAARGFAAGAGVEPGDLEIRDTDRGRYVFARLQRGGEPAGDLLPDLLAGVVRDLPAPRKMRWADVEIPFVRPIAWLVALLGERVLPVEVAGLTAGRVTRGHRFLASEPIELGAAEAYPDALAEAHVIAAGAARREATLGAAREAAAEEGLEVVADDDLLDEVTNLVEQPHGILGAFDEAYLELPDEVLATVMIHHQRYFPTRRPGGDLAPRFVSVSNNRVPDPDVLRRGYQNVLEGRLYDARFFWEADLRKSLSQHAWGLSGVGFQKDLGTMADKVSRVGDAARSVADRLDIGKDERAALMQALPIFRADLATEMVYELPELEGVMARAYALNEGLPQGVAAALEQGVMPKGPDAPLPRSTSGAILSVTDRLDTLIGFFALGKRPTGSADPFGLRRAGIAVARTLCATGWRVAPTALIADAATSYEGGRVEVGAEARSEVEAFLWDRVANLLAEEGVPVATVRAATAARPPVVVAARRAHLLMALQAEAGFPDLLELYKRAANLAAQAPAGATVDPAVFSESYEAPLAAALPPAREAARALLEVANEALEPWDLGHGPTGELPDLGERVAAIVELKEPLDAFLDNVLVMVDDDAVRANRLALLREVATTLEALGALEELES